MILLALVGCDGAKIDGADIGGPSCVEGDLHRCGFAVAQSCNEMLAFDGLTVTFTGGTATSYDATVTMDGVETRFQCADSAATVVSGNVWSCDENGFFVSGNGDDVDVSVTPDGGDVVSDSYTPCWDATEPNGRCCGWNFQAEVELSLGS